MTPALPASRIERRKDEFRSRITRAALKLFAENGMNQTSIAAIIEEADIAHKTFFNHFPTRDHLLQHIVRSHTEHAYQIIREVLKRYNDPAKRIEYCMTQIAKALEPLDAGRYNELVTFYFISSASTKEFRNEQRENFTVLVHGILEEAKAQKRLKLDLDISIQTEMIVGICVSTLLSWSVEEKYPIMKKTKEAISFIHQSMFTNPKSEA